MLFFQSVANRVPPDSDLRGPINKMLDRADKVPDRRARTSPRGCGSDAAAHDLAQALRDAVAEIITAIRRASSSLSKDRSVRCTAWSAKRRCGSPRRRWRNSVQHAEATAIEITLTYGRRNLGLAIRDDGVGIPESIMISGERDGHYGLVGMRERAERAGGRLVMVSRAGEEPK